MIQVKDFINWKTLQLAAIIIITIVKVIITVIIPTEVMLLAQGHLRKPPTLAFSVQWSSWPFKDPPLGHKHLSHTGSLGCTCTRSSGPLLGLCP